MNLNDENIRKALKTYMEKHGKKNYEMSEMCGMSSPSMFSQYLSGVTQTLRAEFFLKFLFNAKIDIRKFLFENFQKQQYENNKLLQTEDPQVEVYSCQNCLPRVKKIKEQSEQIEILKEEKEALKDELLQCYRDKKGNQVANSA